jgi:hypothetical protein
MSFRINRSCRGNLGFFLTSDTDDKCPKEHAVLKKACDVARDALKENKVRARNFLANLVAFDEQIISVVKKAIQDTVAENVELGPSDNREFLDSLQTEGGAFSYAYAVVFACMKRYSDDMMMKLQEEGNKEPHRENRRDENRRDENRRDEPKRRRARNGNVEER